MITTFLRGGLGNQMFQYAAGLNLAKKNDTQLLLDTTFLNDRLPRREFTYRTFDMDILTLEPHFTGLAKASGAVPIPGFWLALDLLLTKTRATLGIQKFIEEKNENNADSQVLGAQGNIFLYGRWQNEKYFEDVADEVRTAFRFRDPLDAEAAQIGKEIASSNSVALCVRRGDFVAFASAKKMMGETNASYFSRAVAYMDKQIKNPRYFVFTDDIEWCKANLRLPANTVFIGKMGPKWSFHLNLMSLCKHDIITNSTFYWWGAWLNRNPGKIVVAPAKWYVDREQQPDIIPEGWIKL